ncbi:hypothetical protein BC835DRAFT_1415742 [Cytidiella melzeri]|nr:hypothetical protein BC835DRAFT_1415742 [Cytidiella melzeri]
MSTQVDAASDEPLPLPPPSPSPSIAPEADRDVEARPTTPPTTEAATPATVKRTPTVNKASSHKLGPKNTLYEEKILAEMGACYVRMPYTRFMKTFVQVSGVAEPDLSAEQLQSMSEKFKSVPAAGVEWLMYAPLCASLDEAAALAYNQVVAAAAGVVNRTTDQTTANATNEAASEACPPKSDRKHYIFKDTSDTPESSGDDLKIDISMYPDTLSAREAYMHDVAPEKLQQRPYAARGAWAWMTMGVEVKRTENAAAFYFEGEDLLRDSDVGKVAQAQLAKYATQIMVRQHRTFVFILYFADKKACITRWDRNGCIVSSSVNYKKEPEKILNFVYRLALMEDCGLGYDTSAVLATEAELEALRKIRPKNPYARDCADEVLDNRVFYPLYKVTCDDLGGHSQSKYFIGKHSVASYSPTGRATKGYVTFDAQRTRLCFLKDYWRPKSSKILPELKIYEELAAHNVHYVAKAIGGGDVGDQCTVTQRYFKWLAEVPLKRCHSRLVLNLARPLEKYTSSSELVVLVFDALRGHEEAWTKAGILHRDISVDNIMRVVHQDDEEDLVMEGILNDWDLCKRKSELEQEARQHGRSGTWAFMSALALQYPLKPYDLADDLEAFIHVISYCCLRFHRHNMTNHEIGVPELTRKDLIIQNGENSWLSNFVWMHFDISNEHKGGISSGGEAKLTSNIFGLPGFTLDPDYVSPVLIDLLGNLYELLKTHYSGINFQELTRYGIQKTLPHTRPAPALDAKAQMEVVQPKLPIIPGLQAKAKVTRQVPLVVTPKPKPRGSQVLSTHEGIVEVFQNALDVIAEDLYEGKPFQLDTTQDQFVGIRELAGIPPKLESGSKRKSESEHIGRPKRSRFNDLGELPEGTEEEKDDAEEVPDA